MYKNTNINAIQQFMVNQILIYQTFKLEIKSLYIVLTLVRMTEEFFFKVFHLNKILIFIILSHIFVTPQHTICLPCPCLSVHKHCTVYSLETTYHDLFHTFQIHTLVIYILTKTMVEFEFHFMFALPY